MAAVFARRRLRRAAAAVAAHGLRRGDGALRRRPARHALRPGDRRRRRGARRLGVQGLRRRAGARRRRARHQRRRARAVAHRARRADRGRQALRRRRASCGRSCEEDGGWRSPIAKFLSRRARSQRDRERAGRHARRPAADRRRRADGRRAPCSARCGWSWRSASGWCPTARHDVLWVVDFPMFERDEDEQRWTALHHPFTAPERRPRRRPGRAALARLRPRAGRQRDRRRLDPHQPPRRAAAGASSCSA